LTPGNPFPLGATPDERGVNFALFSEVADGVELCLFDADGGERRVALREVTYNVWHGHLDDVGPGQRYGYRVHGPWDPAAGLRCNPDKLLLDPHATAIEGEVRWGEEVFGHRFDAPEERNPADSAPSMPRCLVTDRAFDWAGDRRLQVPLEDTIVYETHVKGISATHPDVPAELRGTYAGLAHPAVVDHLVGLGVTAVELLPVHQFVHDAHLLEQGLRNYWGYNSIGYLAPHNGYRATDRPGGQVEEFKAMVKALHAAGLEVILDVVFNHTAEGNHLGPTLSFKGIDNPAYYRLVDGEPWAYFDTTGTGNSFDVSHSAPLGLIMDSLRYWVTDMHVDGFRFDLATTLARQTGAVDQHSSFLDMVFQDPVLAPVKLIAEPWDVGEDGYQVGGFPARWSEWNGRYRDCLRRVWKAEPGLLGELAQRLTGSPDIYSGAGRGPTASVNFVTAHDGFTLADLTAYDHKHNEANGEGNADGDNAGDSWNSGAEGPTDDPVISDLRARQRRNFLATLLVSHGVPMILGGDELGRTQRGNNNAYCQDNELSWYDWSDVDDALLAFTKEAIALRRSHPALRRRRYATGAGPGRPAQRGEIALLRADGVPMGDADWRDPAAKSLMVWLRGSAEPESDGTPRPDGRLLIALNASEIDIELRAPGPEWGDRWRLVLSTDREPSKDEWGAGEARPALSRSLMVFEPA
ncbi:glycogen debranching protein GlgX, partial [Acidimicrobiaceae bacterium USS-CC1]|nr:glycogen debranching protein GlgX [Acidiferrimicrobium australe]